MSGHAWTGSQEFLSLSLPSNAEMLTRAKNTVLFAFLASWNNCIKVESIPLTLIQLYIKDRCGQVCITVIILLARKFRSWAQYKLCGGICKKALPSLTPHLFSMPLQDSDKRINMCQLENHYPGFVLLFVFKWVGDFLKKKPAHFGKSKNYSLLACLFMRVHVLSSNGPSESKGTKLPESSILEPSFLPDPWWNKDPSSAWFSPSTGAQIQSWTNRPFLDGGVPFPKACCMSLKMKELIKWTEPYYQSYLVKTTDS